MVYAHCVLDNKDYRHILRIRNTSCFSMASECASLLLSICNNTCFSVATTVMWMHHNVMFCAQCLSCLKSEWKKENDFSKQNSRNDHTTNSPMATLYTIIGNHIICQPSFCSHISYDKYPWRCLKDGLFKKKTPIPREWAYRNYLACSNINFYTRNSHSFNTFTRCPACLTAVGIHFQQLHSHAVSFVTQYRLFNLLKTTFTYANVHKKHL